MREHVFKFLARAELLSLQSFSNSLMLTILLFLILKKEFKLWLYHSYRNLVLIARFIHVKYD